MTAPDSAWLAQTTQTLHAAGCLFAEEETALIAAEVDAARRDGIVARRAAGEPLELLIGWAEFRGLRIPVASGVFVPRLRSGALVDALAPLLRPADVVVELCCGAGAISAALAHEHPGLGLQLHLGDLDPAAIGCARRALAQVGVSPERAQVGDLFAAIPSALRGRVDAVVANAPYVPTAEIALMPSEAREHEAAAALDGGRDGLDLHRRILDEAPEWLVDDGLLLMETSRRQADADRDLFEAAGYTARVHRDAEVDGTIVVGRLRGSAAP
ncbi:putative protein N(5)-glutamine methyltransferase [Schumannella soli]|uniref:peptide chain release factor N(5)-glutamine methyltransferase n=1 Tax=Schumannella soli TaxID=2590779 RepID=A0A506Y3E5_9MICO|nr:putative protein N(5)-glutamine methyltransferase [Schumannella soli]TPW76120.1 putative protein N(5)-glutamine methyltransferase [Schumannella soli]